MSRNQYRRRERRRSASGVCMPAAASGTFKRVWLDLRPWREQPINKALVKRTTVVAATADNLFFDPIPLFALACCTIKLQRSANPTLLKKFALARAKATAVGLLDVVAFRVRQSLRSSRKPSGVAEQKRISINIGVSVDAALKTNRITLFIGPDDRVVCPIVVVEEVCFLVGVLPREPHREFEGAKPRRILIRQVRAERLLLIPLPDGRSCSVGNKARRVEVIDAYEIKRRRGCLVHCHVHRR